MFALFYSFSHPCPGPTLAGRVLSKLAVFRNNSPYHRPRRSDNSVSRREFLWRSGGGLGGIALAALLGEQKALAAPLDSSGIVSGRLHFSPKAKRVVQLFMAGAASHVDMFDYKPLLIKRHGEKWDVGEKVELFQSDPGACKMHGGMSQPVPGFNRYARDRSRMPLSPLFQFSRQRRTCAWSCQVQGP